VDSEEEG
jgi:hypothetical protein